MSLLAISFKDTMISQKKLMIFKGKKLETIKSNRRVRDIYLIISK